MLREAAIMGPVTGQKPMRPRSSSSPDSAAVQGDDPLAFRAVPNLTYPRGRYFRPRAIFIAESTPDPSGGRSSLVPYKRGLSRDASNATRVSRRLTCPMTRRSASTTALRGKTAQDQRSVQTVPIIPTNLHPVRRLAPVPSVCPYRPETVANSRHDARGRRRLGPSMSGPFLTVKRERTVTVVNLLKELGLSARKVPRLIGSAISVRFAHLVKSCRRRLSALCE